MKRSSIFFVAITIALAGLSALLVVAKDPENFSLQSADGVLHIEGVARENQELVIEVLGPYIYAIGPLGGFFSPPLTLTFTVAEAQFDFAIAVYKYNPKMLMWEISSTPVGTQSTEITIAQSHMGTYTVKEYASIGAPDFVSEYDALLEMAPPSTVGYEIALGFIAQDGSVIRVPDKTVYGGCAGRMEYADGEELSQRERNARVYVNDVEQLVNFLFVARWFTSSAGGCVDTQYLEHAHSFDILEQH